MKKTIGNHILTFVKDLVVGLICLILIFIIVIINDSDKLEQLKTIFKIEHKQEFKHYE